MSVALVPITLDNFYKVVRLTVAEDQRHFVAPNAFSIAEAQFYPSVTTRAIMAGAAGELVGFVMWGEDTAENPGEIWVWRMMIGAEHQGQGYGRAAMEQVIDLVRAAGADALYLSYEPDNSGAAAFYAKLGFDQTGRIEHDEIVVRLALSAAADAADAAAPGDV